jgi:ATP-binding protein involved in chromosome partitioning
MWIRRGTPWEIRNRAGSTARPTRTAGACAGTLWRGPIAHTTLRQLFRDVAWGPLDYLVVDLLPGIGDASFSLTQLALLAGVVLVTTPQRASVPVVAKALAMIKKSEVQIFGILRT